jgi:hypothetical protein
MSKVKFLVGIALSALLLSSCGYQGFYRYPCQNPENWKNAECNPPICEASGTCTKDTLELDPNSDVDTTGGTSNG